MPAGSGDGDGETTPTPATSASTSASPTPLESFYLVAVTDPHANALSTVEPDGRIREITKKVGEQAFQLAWSQNGQRLACVAGTWKRSLGRSTVASVRRTPWITDLAAGEKLELLDRENGEVTELGSNQAEFDVNARSFDEPLIAPTGDAIIFRSAGSDVDTSYTVLDAAGTTPMPAKELLYPAGYAWDPSGQKVVFSGHSTNWKGGSGDPPIFYEFDRAVGGPPKEIARYKKIAVQSLSWSPDGDTIAFAEWDQDTYATGNIHQMSPSGGDADRLADQAMLPAYQPSP